MITVIILAGGESSRIGKDKAFLKLNNKYLIKHVIENISSLSDDILIIAPRKKKYLKLGLPVISDIIPNLGPLGGIYTGLKNSKYKCSLITACDMPFISPSLIKLMFEKRNNCHAVIAKTRKGLQPLCALYSKSCLKVIEKQILSKKLKLKDFLKKIKIKIIDKEILSFYNINTLKSLRLLQVKNKIRRS